MKKTLILTALLLTVLLSAANAASLLVLLNDGTSEEYRFDSKPVIVYEGSKLVVKSAQSETRYECSAVKRLSFDKTPTGVVNVGGNKFMVTVTGNALVAVEGLRDTGAMVYVYEISGRQVESAMPDDEGRVEISLESRPAGIYLINVNNRRTIKIVKR